MKYISLFAGIGGFDLALNEQGHECVYSNDFDEYAAETYNKNFKHKIDTTDIKRVAAKHIPDHDLVVAGFPCQSFSIAGKRRGFKDTRGTMFYEIARIVRIKRPAYLLLENVKGLLSHDNGETFKTIMWALDELGYECQWQVCNSKDFGVPQNRERVFIIGNLRGKPRPKIFPITGYNREAKKQVTSTTIDTNYFKGIDNHGQRTMIGTYRTHKDGYGFREMKSGLAPTLPARARNDGSGQPIVALREIRSEEAKRIRKEYRKQGKDWSPRREKELVARADGNIGTLTAARNFDTTLYDGLKIRRLTPIECERLQGFPDNWTAGVSDTQRYKQLGNAVTVNVVRYIVKAYERTFDTN